MLRLLLSFFLAVAFASALAQDKYPSKPVTVIVPQAPGGANDTVARILMQKVAENTGVQFVIENRTGAGGNIGTAAAAKAPKDGYTILLTVNSSHVINPSIYKNPGFDPVKDFEPITPLAVGTYLLVSSPQFPAKNVKELIALAKSKPGEMTFASSGNGTSIHLSGEMFKSMAGVDMTHIPYKGSGPMLIDLMSGTVNIAFDNLSASMPHIKGGKLRALATTGAKRSPALPDLPTVAEAGVPGYDYSSWIALFAPKGTPAGVLSRLRTEAGRALAAPGMKERLEKSGLELWAVPAEELPAVMREDNARWVRVVREANIKAD